MPSTDPRTSAAWFPERRPQPNPRLRLLCLPFAGGGCAVYRGWQQELGASIEVWAACPPGRERRLREEPAASMAALLDGLSIAAAPVFDGPFAVFGHSFGGLVAHALVQRAASSGGALPRLLAVSGCRPPWKQPLPPLLHDLPAGRFRDELRRLGGTPDVVLDDPELLALFEPALRADLRVSEGWSQERRSLPVPVLALGGENDDEVRAGRLDDWAGASHAGFEQVRFPGGHFYLAVERRPLLTLLGARLLAD